MDVTQVIFASLAVVTTVFVGTYVYTSQKKDDNPFADKNLLEKGMKNPPLWIYVNTSDVNARYWKDFGARSSRVMNTPFLNLCYETIVQKNGKTYRVEVIGGLSDLAVRMGGWETLPTPLQNPEAVVNEPEMNWIRAAVLAKWGGLWVSPSVIWAKSMPPLPKDKVVFFGSDDDVTFVGRGGTEAPSLRVAWSPKSEHSLWMKWETKARHRLETYAGGSQFRHDEKSDTVDAILENKDEVEIFPMAELTRKGAAGRRIQLEDLFAGGQDGSIALKIPKETLYIPIPWPELQQRRNFGWFLRMSEEQILDSDLTVSALFRKYL
jgi:hypothetical protein